MNSRKIYIKIFSMNWIESLPTFFSQLGGNPSPTKCWVTLMPSPISWSITHRFKQPKKIREVPILGWLGQWCFIASFCSGSFCYRGQWFLSVSYRLANQMHYQLPKSSSEKPFHIISSYLWVISRLLPLEKISKSQPLSYLDPSGLGILTHLHSAYQYPWPLLFWTTPFKSLIGITF